MPPGRKSSTRSSRSSSHRSTLSLTRTEIVINVYDLLPPGRISSALWAVGASLLHSGVVVNGKEYAYGGHDRHGVTGVYWTQPQTEPPGGTFKLELLHGFTFASQSEIDAAIRQTSDEFTGTSYNLLHKNCNHFTSALCMKLTNRPAPAWLNRAASIGITFPCIVPRDWIEPPDYENADGELVEDEDDDDEGYDDNEGTRMLRQSRPKSMATSAAMYSPRDSEDQLRAGSSDSERPQGRQSTSSFQGRARDSSGRVLPPSERVPSGSRW